MFIRQAHYLTLVKYEVKKDHELHVFGNGNDHFDTLGIILRPRGGYSRGTETAKPLKISLKITKPPIILPKTTLQFCPNFFLKPRLVNPSEYFLQKTQNRIKIRPKTAPRNVLYPLDLGLATSAILRTFSNISKILLHFRNNEIRYFLKWITKTRVPLFKTKKRFL